MLKDFLKYTSINPRLVRAVVRQSGGWESFKERAKDISSNGAVGGFPGWIYYSETVKFFKNNRKLILELADQVANGFDLGTLDLISSFKSLESTSVDDIAKALYAGKGDEITNVYNAVSWFALEEVAHFYCDWRES